jgi:hypothetical protein
MVPILEKKYKDKNTIVKMLDIDIIYINLRGYPEDNII